MTTDAHSPPEVLFHYTSFSAFIQIVQNRVFWASSIHHMNDAMEFKQALSVADSCVQRHITTPRDDVEKRIRDEMLVNLEGVSGVNIFLISLSENPDLLSQWRSYCPLGQGVAIGLSSGRLRPMLERQGYRLVRCEYDPREQFKLIDPSIRNVIAARKKNYGPDRVIGTPILEQDWVEDLIRVGPLCKHPSFSEEKEWRVVSEPVSIADERIGFREGSTGIIPYFNFSLGDDYGDIPIEEVVVGPSVNQKLAMDSVSAVLLHHGVKNWRVSHSEIPYRSN